MAKTTKKTKKSAFRGKVLTLFQNKAFTMVFFLAVFGLIGGAVYLYKSSAATATSTSLSGMRSISSVRSNDGVVANISCASTYINSIYGLVARCIQHKPGTAHPNFQARPGFWVPSQKVFNVEAGWMPVDSTSATEGPWTNCSGYAFNPPMPGYSNQRLDTGIYGKVIFGQVYRQVNGVWQVSWANKSVVTGQCSIQGNWATATAW